MIYITYVTKNRLIIKKNLRYYITNYRHSLIVKTIKLLNFLAQNISAVMYVRYYR